MRVVAPVPTIEEIFLDLGGFNEVYYPGLRRDADLSYRAWKAGYRVLFCPASKVVHKHRSTNATKLGNRKIDYLIARNLFVLFWQNVTSPRLFFKHLFQLPLRILLDLSRGRFAILRAFLGRVRQASPDCVESRHCQQPGTTFRRRNAGRHRHLVSLST
jgi:GT2 family glycosyltransferase